MSEKSWDELLEPMIRREQALLDKYESMVDGGTTWMPARKGKDAMTPERWAHIKSLQVRPTMMFKSCQPQKDKSTRATYRKSEHGTTDANSD